MTNRLMLLLAGPLLLALGCGDLQSTTAPVLFASYKSNGDIVALVSRELVTLDGQLAAEKQRVPLAGLPAGGEMMVQSISADGQVVAIGWRQLEGGDSCGYAGYVFRGGGAEQLLRRDFPCTGFMRLSPAGDRLAVTGYVAEDQGTKLRVHDLATGSELWSTSDAPSDCAFSPDGTRVYGVSSANDTVTAWDARSGEVLAAQPSPLVDGGTVSPYSLLELAVSPDGQHLVVTMLREPDRQNVDYGWFRASDLQVEQIIPQDPNFHYAFDMAISPDGQRFAAVASNTLPPVVRDAFPPYRVQMWTSSGELEYALDTPASSALSFSPDSRALLTIPYPLPGSPGISLHRVSDGARIASHTFTSDPL